MKKNPEINYDQKLTYKSSWWRYFGEYQYCVDLLFSSLNDGEITVVSLPFAFLIRHTLELGYKANLRELEKHSELKAKINYHGKSAHKIDDLHREFEIQLNSIFKRFHTEKKIINQFNSLNKKLSMLNGLIHKLDELSYSFRYPTKSDGTTPNFIKNDMEDKSDVINFKEIKELYDDSICLLKYTSDVIKEIIETP
jgi:hypothetical protein